MEARKRYFLQIKSGIQKRVKVLAWVFVPQGKSVGILKGRGKKQYQMFVFLSNILFVPNASFPMADGRLFFVVIG